MPRLTAVLVAPEGSLLPGAWLWARRRATDPTAYGLTVAVR
jgi:hypothetical protein